MCKRRYYSTHQSSNRESLQLHGHRSFGTFCGIGALALATTALFCICLFRNEQHNEEELQNLETGLNQALKERKFKEARQLLSVSPETEINNDSLNIALQTGDLMLICDLIEAGAKPNQDSLICAALSAPVFIPYIII